MGGFPAIRVFRTGNPDLTNQVRAGILEIDSGRCFARQFSSVWFARKGFPLTARVLAGRSTRCWSKNKYARHHGNPRYHMDADLYDTSFVHTTSLLSSRSEPNRLFTKQRPCPRMSGDFFILQDSPHFVNKKRQKRAAKNQNPDLTNQVRAGILETDLGRCRARQFSPRRLTAQN